jgi:hypothetical protein
MAQAIEQLFQCYIFAARNRGFPLGDGFEFARFGINGSDPVPRAGDVLHDRSPQ